MATEGLIRGLILTVGIGKAPMKIHIYEFNVRVHIKIISTLRHTIQLNTIAMVFDLTEVRIILFLHQEFSMKDVQREVERQLLVVWLIIEKPHQCDTLFV